MTSSRAPWTRSRARRWREGLAAAVAAVFLHGQARALVLSVDPTLGVGYAKVKVANAAATGPAYISASDEFLSFGLAARLRLSGAVMQQSLGYSLFATEYAGSVIPSNLAHSLSWQITGTPTGRTQVLAGVTASRMSTSAATPIDAVNGSTTAAPLAATTITSAGVNETFAYEPTGNRRFSENLALVLARSEGLLDSTSLQMGGQARAEQLSGRNTFSLTAMGNATSFLSVASGMTGSGVPGSAPPVGSFDSSTTFTGQLLAGWDRQHSATVTTAVQAGALVIYRPRYDQVAMAPAFHAIINYASIPWFATLAVFQQPTVNIYIGNAVIADGVSLRVSLPLDKSQQWTVSALGGYTYGRAVVPGKGLFQWERGYDLLTFGLSSTYVFQRYPVFLSVNYTGMTQRGSQLAEFALPSNARSLFWVGGGLSLAWGEGQSGFARRR